MMTTPGITEKEFTKDPLGTEGELSLGPNDANPWRSIDEKEIVEDYKERLRQDRSEQPELVKVPLSDPTEGNDPFVFDDVAGEVGDVQLPFMENDGPEF